jgi:hypothetical protein
MARDTLYGSIRERLENGNHAGALRLLRPSLHNAGARQRQRFLNLLSRFGQRQNGSLVRRFLDSLSAEWHAGDNAAAQRARIPYLLAGGHWSEAANAISDMRVSNSIPAAYLDRIALFIQASDSATRQAFISDYFTGGRVRSSIDPALIPVVTTYLYAPVAADRPYSMAKPVDEQPPMRGAGLRLTVFPNPTYGGPVHATVAFDAGEGGVLSVHSLFGVEILRMTVTNDTREVSRAVDLGQLPVGVWIVIWKSDAHTEARIIKVLR